MSNIIPIRQNQVISYVDDRNVRAPTNSLTKSIQRVLRNSFFLPLYKREIAPELAADQRLAKKISYALQNKEVACKKELEEIRNHFSIRDIDVRIEGPIIRIFTVRSFESLTPIGGKTLRVILFSFNGNSESKNSRIRAWNPLTIEELSKSPLSVLKAFQATGVRVHSLMTHSLGNVALSGLSISTSGDTLPPTFIIDRGFTSTKKVTHQLYSFPINSILYRTARSFKWDGDPEKNFLECIKANSDVHKVVLIEAKKDFYFSGKGAFESDFHEKIAQLGISVSRINFWPHPFHARAHHAIPLNHLEQNSETEVIAGEDSFDLKDGESMAAAIARNIFLEGDEESHTCFRIAGSDASLDSGTAREVVPLLSAFIKEGAALEANGSLSKSYLS